MKTTKRLTRILLVLSLLLTAVMLFSSCASVCRHIDADDDERCDKCGSDFEDKHDVHVDKDDNGYCDFIGCGFEYYDGCDNHIDKNDDEKCDKCQLSFTDKCDIKHIDAQKNGVCDRCGEKFNSGKFYVTKTRISLVAKEIEQHHYYNVSGMLVLTEVFNYDIQKEKVVDTNPIEIIVYTYDESGNLTSKTTRANDDSVTSEKTYKYDSNGRIVELVSTDLYGSEKYTYTYADGRLATEIYETDHYIHRESERVHQKSTTVYNYLGESTLNCKFATTVVLTFSGVSNEYKLTGHKTYDERGDFFSYSCDAIESVTIIEIDGVKTPVLNKTYEAEKYRYLYDDSNDFDGDLVYDSVIVKKNTYTEWDELLSTERYLYDDYGNLLSYKQVNPDDNSVIYAEVNTHSNEMPTK